MCLTIHGYLSDTYLCRYASIGLASNTTYMTAYDHVGHHMVINGSDYVINLAFNLESFDHGNVKFRRNGRRKSITVDSTDENKFANSTP